SAVKEPKAIDASYNTYNNKLELNLKNDTLDYVVKKISQLTGKNIIATKSASIETVSGFIGQTVLEQALEQMSKRNNLLLTIDENGYYLLDKTEKSEEAG